MIPEIPAILILICGHKVIDKVLLQGACRYYNYIQKTFLRGQKCNISSLMIFAQCPPKKLKTVYIKKKKTILQNLFNFFLFLFFFSRKDLMGSDESSKMEFLRHRFPVSP